MIAITIIISNTGPLIALAKINALDLIFQLFGINKIFVPQEVVDEILYPKEIIESYIKVGKIVVLPPVPDNETYKLQTDIAIESAVKSDPRQWTPKQAKAEATAIYHSIQQKADFLLIDDGAAQIVARQEHVPHMKHLTLIKKCVEKKHITSKQGLDMLNNLEEKGYKYKNLNNLREKWKNG